MTDTSRVFINSIHGYAMVNIRIKKDQLLGEARRKVKFDTPEIIEDAHVPTKVSIVPRLGNQESQRLTEVKYKKGHLIYFRKRTTRIAILPKTQTTFSVKERRR